MGMNPISFSGDRLRFFGFASGLDIDEIVQKLMTVERIPVDRLEQRRQLLVWTKQDYWAIRRGLDELRNAVSPLKYSSTFAARKATSTNEAVAVASVSAGAPEGVYTVKVTQLAQGIQVASSGAITRSPTGDRTSLWTQFGIDTTASPTIDLTLTVTDSQGVQHTKTLSFSAAAGDDINDVVAAINNAGLGVTAAYDATLDRLFLSSKETGSKVQLTVTDQAVTLSGGGTANVWADLFKLPTTASGQDAVFDLNGATGLQEPTNQFTIAGVTYDLRGLGTTTITVSQDTDAVVASIKAWVDQYNAALGQINLEVSERRLYDYPPLTDAQKKEMTPDEIKAWEEKARQGLLQGDALLVRIGSEMRMAVTSAVNGTGSTYTTLASIGITTGDWFEDGLLHVDEAKLRQALEADPDGVAALFGASGATTDTQGVAVRLGKELDDAVGFIRDRAGLEGIEVDQSGLGRQIELLDDQIQRWEERLATIEERYYRQFTVMEQVLAQLGSQATWLGQQFAQTGG
ncbi:flagellar filament capping protein FliD [Carboxydochorda subterranea]|uniref:Flagellar hook-associated protein 2 n=1 Tax=Carboxydichorda subterranea TaxID=3109565 RepID=A0ABZ1BTT8_9FIRM|nr:flagellar filament capping protein FliD [Limnochorda sp. L945t]WRP16189.1 flagellar filament capping protein FliD [Limnochorda sp. L945t]